MEPSAFSGVERDAGLCATGHDVQGLRRSPALQIP